MKFQRTLILFSLFIALPAFAAGVIKIWDTTEEAIPVNSESLSLANERMHDDRVNARARMEVEHWVGSVGDGSDDNGMHRDGSARCFAQDAEPSALTNSMGTLDSTAPNRKDVTDLDDSASNSGGAVADDVGHGRCWIDTNNSNTFQAFIGVAGDDNGAWADVKVGSAGTADNVTAAGGGSLETDDQILAGSPNLVYNGSFEASDGTGSASSTTVPVGWALVTTPTIGYTDPSGDDSYGEGYQVDVTNAGVANEGISFELDALPEDAFYKVIARAIDDGTAECTLDVTGEGGTAFTPVATTTNAWETLSGTFGTSTSAKDDDVLITLVTTGADTTVCSWDHVRVYQYLGDSDVITDDRAELSTWGGVILVTDTVTIETGMADDTPAQVGTLAVTVTPPSQNCVVEVDAVIAVQLSPDTADQILGVTCLIDENSSTKTIANFGGANVTWEGTSGTDQASFNIPLHYDLANPAPGTPLVYEVHCSDKMHKTDADDSNYDCSDASCFLNAKMFCGGN